MKILEMATGILQEGKSRVKLSLMNPLQEVTVFYTWDSHFSMWTKLWILLHCLDTTCIQSVLLPTFMNTSLSQFHHQQNISQTSKTLQRLRSKESISVRNLTVEISWILLDKWNYTLEIKQVFSLAAVYTKTWSYLHWNLHVCRLSHYWCCLCKKWAINERNGPNNATTVHLLRRFCYSYGSMSHFWVKYELFWWL